MLILDVLHLISIYYIIKFKIYQIKSGSWALPNGFNVFTFDEGFLKLFCDNHLRKIILVFYEFSVSNFYIYIIT